MAPGFMSPKKAMHFFHMNQKQQVQNTLESSFQAGLLPDACVDILSVITVTRRMRSISFSRIPFHLRPDLRRWRWSSGSGSVLTVPVVCAPRLALLSSTLQEEARPFGELSVHISHCRKVEPFTWEPWQTLHPFSHLGHSRHPVDTSAGVPAQALQTVSVLGNVGAEQHPWLLRAPLPLPVVSSRAECRLGGRSLD